MTTAIIVQARMSSQRLPGKVMMTLGSKTVLGHVLERCKRVTGADKVCCAIPESSECDILFAEAERYNAEIFRGSEQDVLRRYYECAKRLKAKNVVRITSDCPLIDPTVVDGLIDAFRANNADYASNNYGETPDGLNVLRSWPHGLDCEVFTFEMLEMANGEIGGRFAREHVSGAIRNNPNARKCGLDGPGGAIANHRWTLDTQTDYEFLAKLFQFLPSADFSWQTTLSTIESSPALRKLSLSYINP
ncbi:MAG: glycosyltransferase family protein [Rhodospirillaceae bacterium]